jgi:2-methylcitrate dehydratase PrpD
MTAVTAALAAHAAGLEAEALSGEVRARAALLLLDLAGNIIRARYDAESTPALLAAVRALGLAPGSHGVFGCAMRYTAAGAALLNGALGHSLDFDDTHAPSSLHPGAPVIPAALAAAEMTGAKGRDVIAAIVAGYDVTCRIALALPAAAHYDRGFHPTATCGAFGAAAAAGRVFGLDAETIASAFGIALSQSAGSLQFLANGAWTKRFQVGWAAMAGLSAATLARAGFKGAAEAFEGRHGFLAAYAPSPTPELALEQLGERFELMRTAVKPYPSCRYGHAAIDAALELRARLGLRPEEISRITIGLPRAGMLLIGAPIEKKRAPENVVDGQFSAPFVVAVALATGRMGWDSYRLHLGDPAIQALMARTECIEDPEIEALFPRYMAGRVSIEARGERFVETVEVPSGEPENFPEASALIAKFDDLAAPVLGAQRSRHLAERLLGLEEGGDIGALFALAAPVAAARLASD